MKTLALNKYLLLGVYIHEKRSTFALVELPVDKESHYEWTVDTGMTRNHPFFRNMKQLIVRQGQGEYFFNKALRGYIYLGDL